MRLSLQGGSQAVDCFDKSALLHLQDAEKAQGVEIFRQDTQNFEVLPCRRIKLPLLMELQSLLQHPHCRFDHLICRTS